MNLPITEQLAEIRKSSLARMLCDNGDAMDFIQPRAMESVGPGNERLPCSSNQIPTTDLNQWEDEDSVVVDAIIWNRGEKNDNNKYNWLDLL